MAWHGEERGVTMPLPLLRFRTIEESARKGHQIWPLRRAERRALALHAVLSCAVWMCQFALLAIWWGREGSALKAVTACKPDIVNGDGNCTVLYSSGGWCWLWVQGRFRVIHRLPTTVLAPQGLFKRILYPKPWLYVKSDIVYGVDRFQRCKWRPQAKKHVLLQDCTSQFWIMWFKYKILLWKFCCKNFFNYAQNSRVSHFYYCCIWKALLCWSWKKKLATTVVWILHILEFHNWSVLELTRFIQGLQTRDKQTRSFNIVTVVY